MCLIFLLIFLFIPWQVAFVGCWMIHLYTCATSFHQHLVSSPSGMQLVNGGIGDNDGHNDNLDDETSSSQQQAQHHRIGDANQNTHILLLMTLLLPFAAPVLVVWVRTLATAG